MTTRFYVSGKGGVGKTSMACATAVRFADEGKKTALFIGITHLYLKLRPWLRKCFDEPRVAHMTTEKEES